MVWNNTRNTVSTAIVVAAALLASGCTVLNKDRESPVTEVTKDSPTVLDVYRGTDYRSELERQKQSSAQDRFREKSPARAVNRGDEITQRYWSAVEPMNQRFARVPNPDLVMVVFPHLAKGQYPVPGYVTVFPMYERVEYALPGEISEDLLAWRASYFDTKPERETKKVRESDAGKRIMPRARLGQQTAEAEATYAR